MYEKVYRRIDFSFSANKKDYTNRIINITFKYSVADYNKAGKNRYIKYGYCERDAQFVDNVWIVNEQLAGIILEAPVTKPIDSEMLGDYFVYEDGCYRKVKNPAMKINTANLRQYLYNNGFVCNGVKYVRWKRSSGSSRVGKCLFIDQNLYPRMHKWEFCGLKIKEGQEVDLAALESYISLVSSSIVDTIEIQPYNILVVPDYESVFNDHIISVEENNGKIVAAEKTCEIRNSIFDGEGLIDPSLMGEYSDKGMILLRNLFFKCCCFNTNIQQWFADNDITSLEQLNGSTVATSISDIKIITTPSSIKYLKFGKLDGWLKKIGSTFGVVKYDKPPHYEDGRMTQTHYQLLNTLQMTQDEVNEFLQPSLDYIGLIKSDIDIMRRRLKYPIEQDINISSAVSKNDIIYKLLGTNEKFAETKIYYEFKRDVIRSMYKQLKMGHVLVEGNYSTLLGNPMEMLLQAIGKFDGTSSLGIGNVHSTRFEYDKILLASRSPHISMSNILLTHNKADELIDKYFNLTPQIICINSIGENILQQLSGCDFDSDTVLITDDISLIKAAMKNLNKFPIAVCNVASIKRKREYTKQQQCDLDIKTSNNLIGDIINLSQELNTMIWDKINNGAAISDVMPIYLDVCKLNILSGLEIDKAKKEFTINNAKELKEIREKYIHRDKRGRAVKPNFFAVKDKNKGYYDTTSKNYLRHKTTMDYLQHCVLSYSKRTLANKSKLEFLPFSAIIDFNEYDYKLVKYDQAKRIIDTIIQTRKKITKIFTTDFDSDEKFYLSNVERQNCIEYIGNLKISQHTMIYILKNLESAENTSATRTILNILFGYPNSDFYKFLINSQTTRYELAQSDDGEITIYSKKYTKKAKKSR